MAGFRLIVGLGNIGRNYTDTRHNVGFWWADELARALCADFSHEARFSGELAKTNQGLRLLKPMTYMNLSGHSVLAVAQFFDIAPEEMLVVHDDLDLLPGAVRLKQGGGHAGHNGLRDIGVKLGSADFWRLRFGIGHPRHSETPQQAVADYVLKPPLPDELPAIEKAMKKALDVWPLLARGDDVEAMRILHTDAAGKPASKTDKESSL